jgi:hypothetical protein
MWKGDIPNFTEALKIIIKFLKGIVGIFVEEIIIPVINKSEAKAWTRKYLIADSASIAARIISLVNEIKLISSPIHTISQWVEDKLNSVPMIVEVINKGKAKGDGIIKMEEI